METLFPAKEPFLDPSSGQLESEFDSAITGFLHRHGIGEEAAQDDSYDCGTIRNANCFSQLSDKSASRQV